MVKFRATLRTANPFIPVLIHDAKQHFTAVLHLSVHTSGIGRHRFGLHRQNTADFTAWQATFDNRLPFHTANFSDVTIGFKLRFNHIFPFLADLLAFYFYATAGAV
jgi:hypothetical protein